LEAIAVLRRVARAVESVVPDLLLEPRIGDPVFFEQDSDLPAGEWSESFGFSMTYRGEDLGAFEHASTGPESEQLCCVVQELLSEIQDEISKATTEPWPFVMKNGRRDFAFGNAAIVGHDLEMWYGDHDAPALRIPTIALS
jgi:hypothetical protein